jgi:Tfx family DNA-binding protein
MFTIFIQSIMDAKETILTARQLEILGLRSRGMSTEEIASNIRTSTKNVIIIEAAMHRKLERAANTMKLVQEGGLASSVTVGSGTHLLDAVRSIIDKADEAHIKLRGNLLDLMSSIRTFAGNNISGGLLTKPLSVMLFRTGRWIVTA